MNPLKLPDLPYSIIKNEPYTIINSMDYSPPEKKGGKKKSHGKKNKKRSNKRRKSKKNN